MLSMNRLIESLGFDLETTEFINTYTINELEYRICKSLFYGDFSLFLKHIKEKPDMNAFALKLYLCLAAENYETIIKRLGKKERVLLKYGMSPERVFFDTVSDIRIWQEVYKRKTLKTGLTELKWVANCVKGDLYRFERLQFEPDKNTSIVHIHIPEGEKLDIEKCKKSIDLAKDFFEGYSGFDCLSWLLSPKILQLLSKDSNIRKFQALFDVKYINYSFAQASERVLEAGDEKGQRSSLYLKLKEYLKENSDPGMGYGVIERA